MLNDRYWDMCMAIVTHRGKSFCGPKQSWKAYIVHVTVILLKGANPPLKKSSNMPETYAKKFRRFH